MKNFLLALVSVLVISGCVSLLVVNSMGGPKRIPINALAQMVKDGQIASIDVDGTSRKTVGEFSERVTAVTRAAPMPMSRTLTGSSPLIHIHSCAGVSDK